MRWLPQLHSDRHLLFVLRITHTLKDRAVSLITMSIQWSLYFKTTHGTKKMWSYIAGGLKIKVIYHRKLTLGTKSNSLIIKGGLKIESCKIEVLLYFKLSHEITANPRTPLGALDSP